MQLLQFIGQLMNDPKTSESSRESFSLVCNTLRQYLDGDIDILQTAVPGWSDDYYEFLLNRYTSRNGRLSPKTASQRWSQFRGILRHAVRRNIYPDIEIDPGGYTNPAKTQTRRPRRDSIAAELDKLEGLLRRKSDKWLQRYCDCLRLGGLETTQLSMLMPQPDSDGQTVVTLPQFGIQLTIPSGHVPTVNGTDNAPSPVTSDQAQTQQSPQSVPAETIIASVLRQHGLRLMQAGNIFTDWLCLIKERGTPDEVIRDIIGLRFATDKRPTTLLTDTILSLLSSQNSNEALKWYALMTIGQTPSQVMDELDRTLDLSRRLKRGERAVQPGQESLLNLRDDFAVNDRLIPYDKTRDSANEQLRRTASVLYNIMFVRMRPDDIRLMSTLVRNAYVYSAVIDGRRVYTSIPPIQIYRMRRMLNYLADYTDNIDDSTLDIDIPDDLQPGERVQICLPGFEKYDVIVDSEETERDRRRMGRKVAPGTPGTNIKNYYLLFRCDNNIELRLPFPRDLLRRI